jgi:hypothetical protein
MQVICLEEPAFYALVDQAVNHIKTKQKIKEDKWISGEESMKLLLLVRPPCRHTGMKVLFDIFRPVGIRSMSI